MLANQKADKPFVRINYNSIFSAEQIRELKSIFPDFEVETHQWGIVGRNIDVLPVLEIAVAFALVPYFTGFFSEAGKKTWEQIAKNFSRCIKKHRRDQETIAFVFYIDDIPIYLIDRFYGSNKDELIWGIPFLLEKVEEFFKDHGFPDDTKLMQVFQDPQSGMWKYLLMPTYPHAFENFVDRVLDLETFKETVA